MSNYKVYRLFPAPIFHFKVKKFTDISATVSSMEPEEGDLLLFPSYLYHAVEENLSDNNRIVISFNVDIDA